MITGASGCIGSALIDLLLENTDCELYAIELPRIKPYRPNEVTYFSCDITDSIHVSDIFKEVQPDYVYHLAGQSFFNVGQENPRHTIDVNVLGTMNILEAIRRQGNMPRKVIVTSSASIYGTSNHLPTNEDAPLKPLGIYASSKGATDLLCYQYYMNYGLPIVTVRPFIILGTRQQVGNAVNSFANQIATIEKNGGKGIIRVGNLDTSRDMTDAIDCVKALWQLSNFGINGEAYNICSGTTRKMKDVLYQLLSLSDADIKIEVDESRLRPSDTPVELGSNHKLNSLTGWQPEIPFINTLERILNYWRGKDE